VYSATFKMPLAKDKNLMTLERMSDLFLIFLKIIATVVCKKMEIFRESILLLPTSQEKITGCEGSGSFGSMY